MAMMAVADIFDILEFSNYSTVHIITEECSSMILSSCGSLPA
jgi:hypothetical protein